MARLRLRNVAPNTATDLIAMMFTFIVIPIAYLHGVFYVTPIIWPTHTDELRELNGSMQTVNFLAMTFLLVSGVASLWMVIIVDTSCGRISLPVVSQPGWHFCPFCQHYAPPRAHHCGTCNKCILRHDHHCFFAGKCVGYYNQRYFISFLLFVFAGSTYATVLSFWAISILVGGFGGFAWSVLPAILFPVLMWVLQMVPLSPLVLMTTSLSVFISLGAGVLLGLQLLQLRRGQTFWEFRRKVLLYDRGLVGNAREILGARWWLCWLFPFIGSPQPGDGSHFPPINATPSSHANSNSHVPAKQSAQTGGAGGPRKMVKEL